MADEPWDALKGEVGPVLASIAPSPGQRRGPARCLAVAPRSISAAAAEARELSLKGGLVRDWDWAPWDMFQEKEGWDRSVYGTRFWHSGNTAVVRVNGQQGGQPERPRVSPTRACWESGRLLRFARQQPPS